MISSTKKYGNSFERHHSDYRAMRHEWFGDMIPAFRLSSLRIRVVLLTIPNLTNPISRLDEQRSNFSVSRDAVSTIRRLEIITGDHHFTETDLQSPFTHKIVDLAF